MTTQNGMLIETVGQSYCRWLKEGTITAGQLLASEHAELKRDYPAEYAEAVKAIEARPTTPLADRIAVRGLVQVESDEATAARLCAYPTSDVARPTRTAINGAPVFSSIAELIGAVGASEKGDDGEPLSYMDASQRAWDLKQSGAVHISVTPAQVYAQRHDLALRDQDAQRHGKPPDESRAELEAAAQRAAARLSSADREHLLLSKDGSELDPRLYRETAVTTTQRLMRVEHLSYVEASEIAQDLHTVARLSR